MPRVVPNGVGAVADRAERSAAGRLEGHHVLVTGGARGIGEAIVEKSLGEGARVSFLDLDEGAGNALLKRLNASKRLSFSVGDVRKAEDIAAAHEAAKSKLGPVTAPVNNAGRNSYADPVEMTEAQWDDVFSVDLKSARLVARAILPDMIAAAKGSIVNIASLQSEMTCAGMFPYAAAKSGLVGLTRSLALEMGPHQIRVNALSPGFAETALVTEFFAQSEPSLRKKVVEAHPMRRMAKPSEIAIALFFYCPTKPPS